jgi:hypothetical protein
MACNQRVLVNLGIPQRVFGNEVPAYKHKSKEARRLMGSQMDQSTSYRGRILGNKRPRIGNVQEPTKEPNGYGDEIEEDSLAISKRL